jgi:hypothetical protein
MNACADRERWLARVVDGTADLLTDAERAALDAHLAICAGCRDALEDQRFVSGLLRSRPPLRPSPAFAARLSSRLDDVSGWLGLLDWQAWTFRLAPVAVGLLLAAIYSGAGSPVESNAPSSPTLETWARDVADASSAASAVWQGDASPDALIESMLGVQQGREGGDVR